MCRALADAHFLEARDHARLGVVDAEPVQEIGVDDDAVLDERRIGDTEGLGVGIGRRDHREDRQAVLGSELVIALVVSGTTEDRAGAVLHQHEIGGVDRHGLARDQRVSRQQRQFVADLFGGLDLGRRRAGLAALGHEAFQAGVVPGQLGDDWMFGRKCCERGAVERVGAGGEDFQFATICT